MTPRLTRFLIAALGVGWILAGGPSRAVTPPPGLVSWWQAEGNAVDSVDGSSGALFGGVSFASGVLGQGFRFNGVDGRIAVPDANKYKITDSLTLAAWINITALPSVYPDGKIIFRGDDRGGLDPYSLNLAANGNAVLHISSLTQFLDLSAPVPVGRFVFLVGTLDGSTGTMLLYENGQIVASTTTTVRPFGDLDPAYSPGLGIGNTQASAYREPFYGVIDEAQIYNRALTTAEVQALFQSYAPANDNFASAQALTGPSGSVISTNVGATKEPGEPNHDGTPGGASVWYRWTPSTTGRVTFGTTGNSFNTLLGVYTGSAVSSLTTLAGNNLSITFNALAGVTYSIAVDGPGGLSGGFTLNWSTAPAPPNDNFASAQVITGSSGTVNGTNLSASSEPGEPLHAGVPGGASVWYSWTAPVTGSITFSTLGSSFDTLLAVYTGSAVNSLAVVAFNDDDPEQGRSTSKVTFTAALGTTYYLAVDGNHGAEGSISLYWSPNPFYWGAEDIAVGPDNRARLLWGNDVGRITLWNVMSSGDYSVALVDGPFPGWTNSRLAAGSDGLTRVLWNFTDGTASIWLRDTSGTSATGFNFGPYPGWTALDVAVGSDNQARILWINTSGAVAVWSVNNSGAFRSGPGYGPYPGWTARSIAAGSDGVTRILWNNTDGRIAIWLMGSDNLYQASYGYGPYPGWSAADITVGVDNLARVLWTNTDGSMCLWSIDNSGFPTFGPGYGPYPGWTAFAIAAGGTDTLTRVLWNKADGEAALWLLGPKNLYQASFGYGPY